MAIPNQSLQPAGLSAIMPPMRGAVEGTIPPLGGGMPFFEDPSWTAPEPTSPQTYQQPVEQLGTIQTTAYTDPAQQAQQSGQIGAPVDTTIQAAQFFVSEFAAIVIALDAVSRETAKYPNDLAAALAHSTSVTSGLVAAMTRYNKVGIAFDATIMQVAAAVEIGAKQLTALRDRRAAADAAAKANYAERDRLTAQAQPATRQEAHELQAVIRTYDNAGAEALKEAYRVNQLIISLSSVSITYITQWQNANEANRSAVRSAKELGQEARILHNYITNLLLEETRLGGDLLLLEQAKAQSKIIGGTIENQGKIIKAMEKLAEQDKGIIDKILAFFGGAAKGTAAAAGGVAVVGAGVLLLWALSKRKK